MKRNKMLDWFFGETGGLISPEVKSPWGILIILFIVYMAAFKLIAPLIFK